MARKYTRDARGRFASGGGGGSSRPARKAAPTRAGNRLNRDNSGRITGIGRDGATARGGRLKTASGARRATQTASLKAPGFRSGTIAKGGRGVSGSVARSLAATKRGRAKPSAPKVDLTDAGFTRRLRRAQRNLSDAQKDVRARGMSEYDYKGKARLGRLQSAVDSLKFARTTVRRNTVTNIKTTDKALIENYNRQLAATKRKAASTPSGGRSTTAPKLTPSQKAAVTRQRNRAARDEENRRRWEQVRRYG